MGGQGKRRQDTLAISLKLIQSGKADRNLEAEGNLSAACFPIDFLNCVVTEKMESIYILFLQRNFGYQIMVNLIIWST